MSATSPPPSSSSTTTTTTNTTTTTTPATTWTYSQVVEWLTTNGFSKYKQLFIDHHISGNVLLELDYDTLRDMNITSLADRARLVQAIKRLRLDTLFTFNKRAVPSLSRSTASAPSILNVNSSSINNNNNNNNDENDNSPSPNEPNFLSAINNTLRFPQVATNAEIMTPLQRLMKQHSMPNYPSNTDDDNVDNLILQEANKFILNNDNASSTSPSSTASKFKSRFGGFKKYNLPPRTHSIRGNGENEDSSPSTSPEYAGFQLAQASSPVAANNSVNEFIIKVSGTNNQMHMINISDLINADAQPKLIRERVLIKFRIDVNEWDRYALFTPNERDIGQFSVLSDNELLDLIRLHRERKVRGALHLYVRKRHMGGSYNIAATTTTTTSTVNPNNPTNNNAIVIGPRSQSNAAAVAAAVGLPNSLNLNSLSNNSTSSTPNSSAKRRVSNSSRRSKKMSLIRPRFQQQRRASTLSEAERVFGDRPSSEFIADQLEKYFPQLINEDETVSTTTTSIISSVATTPLTTTFSPNLAGPRSSIVSLNSPANEALRTKIQQRLSVRRASKVDTVNRLQRRLSSKLLPITPLSASPEKVDSLISQPLQPPSSLNDSDSQALADLAAQSIGKYDWVRGELLGAGSFGKVYIGLNTVTGEIMAVKQVELPSAGSEKAALARKKMVDAILREMNVLKDLEHDHIVKYLGMEYDSMYINVFLEYISGGSVESLLQKIGKFDTSLVKSLALQVLLGLEYLHARSIIHRDIKSGNVLIDEHGVVKISDFGISKRNEYHMAYKFNSRMSVQGSVFWMAPEVIKAKGYSAKVDIWSLGCVLLEMFTGHRPWRTFDEVATMYKLGTMNAPPIPDSLPDDGKRILQECFQLDPDKRPMATELLKHPFVVNLDEKFVFEEYYEKSLEAKKRESMASVAMRDDDYFIEEEDDEDEDEDEDEDDLEDMEDDDNDYYEYEDEEEYEEAEEYEEDEEEFRERAEEIDVYNDDTDNED